MITEDRRRGCRGGCIGGLLGGALLLLLVGGVVAVVWFLTTRGSPATGILTGLSGTVEAREESAAAWSPTADGQEVHAGERVRTGTGSAATIVYFDASSIILGENTEVSIDEASSNRRNGGDVTLTNWRGTTDVRMIRTNDTSSEFVVLSPIASTTLSGSELSVSVAGDTTTVVTMQVGSADVTSLGGTITRRPGGHLRPALAERVQAGESVTLVAGQVATITPDGRLTVAQVETLSANPLVEAVTQALSAPGTQFTLALTEDMVNDSLAATAAALGPLGITSPTVFFTNGQVVVSGKLAPGTAGIPIGGPFTATATPGIDANGDIALTVNSLTVAGVSLPVDLVSDVIPIVEGLLQDMAVDPDVPVTLTSVQVNEGSMTVMGTKPPA